jgi:hypothetical protein
MCPQRCRAQDNSLQLEGLIFCLWVMVGAVALADEREVEILFKPAGCFPSM